MLKLNVAAMLLLLGMGLSACASQPTALIPVEAPKAQLPPPPAEVMVERQPNFRERLLAIFSRWSTTPTK